VRSVSAARREQRIQLARDVHDWLAHEVTGIVLEAQSAQLAVVDREEIELALKRIEEAGVRTLDSMDRAIQLLRDRDESAASGGGEQVHGLDDLREVVGRFATASSARVELVMAEGTEHVRPETAETGYRVVLESLTNVRRHASRARLVRISVRRCHGHLELIVTDDGDRGPGPRPFGRRGGAGLSGLADRVEALGGTLRAGPVEPAGWSVRALLPVTS
jgi:signal transduction histidine kinase